MSQPPGGPQPHVRGRSMSNAAACAVLCDVHDALHGDRLWAEALQRCVHTLNDAPREVWESVVRLCVDQGHQQATKLVVGAAQRRGHRHIAHTAAAPLPCNCDHRRHCRDVVDGPEGHGDRCYQLSGVAQPAPPPPPPPPATEQPQGPRNQRPEWQQLRGAAEAAAVDLMVRGKKTVPLRLPPVFVALLNNDAAMMQMLIMELGVLPTQICDARDVASNDEVAKMGLLEFAALHDRIAAAWWLLSPPPPTKLRRVMEAFVKLALSVGKPPPPELELEGSVLMWRCTPGEVGRDRQRRGPTNAFAMNALEAAACVAAEQDHCAFLRLLVHSVRDDAWGVFAPWAAVLGVEHHQPQQRRTTTLIAAARRGSRRAVGVILAMLILKELDTPLGQGAVDFLNDFDMRRAAAADPQRCARLMAFVNCRDASGYAALHYAVMAAAREWEQANAERRESMLALITILMRSGGADVDLPVADATAHSGMTALQIALRYGSVPIAKVLLPYCTLASFALVGGDPRTGTLFHPTLSPVDVPPDLHRLLVDRMFNVIAAIGPEDVAHAKAFLTQVPCDDILHDIVLFQSSVCRCPAVLPTPPPTPAVPAVAAVAASDYVAAAAMGPFRRTVLAAPLPLPLHRVQDRCEWLFDPKFCIRMRNTSNVSEAEIRNRQQQLLSLRCQPGNSPLHEAVARCRTDRDVAVIEALVNAGADPFALDAGGATALQRLSALTDRVRHRKDHITFWCEHTAGASLTGWLERLERVEKMLFSYMRSLIEGITTTDADGLTEVQATNLLIGAAQASRIKLVQQLCSASPANPLGYVVDPLAAAPASPLWHYEGAVSRVGSCFTPLSGAVGADHKSGAETLLKAIKEHAGNDSVTAVRDAFIVQRPFFVGPTDATTEWTTLPHLALDRGNFGMLEWLLSNSPFDDINDVHDSKGLSVLNAVVMESLGTRAVAMSPDTEAKHKLAARRIASLRAALPDLCLSRGIQL